MITIKQTVTHLTKKEGTKTAFKVEDKETKIIPEQHYKNATSQDTIKFFKRLGGSESVTRAYTCYGYTIIKVISTSPDRTKKTIREYEFIYND